VSPHLPRLPLGIVVPALDEAARLPLLLRDLANLPFPHEIVVADGGSGDGTAALAERAGARVVRSTAGRARQMNRGAEALETPWLLFLHADTRLTPEVGPAIARWLDEIPSDTRSGDEPAAFFGFRLEGEGAFWRFIERGQGIRERFAGLVYGDQGLLVSRAAFLAVGGFEDVPLMEDVRMIRSLRRRVRVERLPASLLTSPRRYEQEGRWRAFLRNALLIALHGMRVPPGVLAPWYRTRRDAGTPGALSDAGSALPTIHAPAPPARTLMIFAKAPVPGSVKTRLAAEIGDGAATALYRRMGREIVDRVRSGPHRTVILFDPPDALAMMHEWLGTEGLDFRPQSEGDLGERLDAAFRECLAPGTAACVIGTDIPGLTLARIEEAWAALELSEIVLGPAEDGGYYLLGLNRPAPALFEGIEWSTSVVLERTRERAARLGLRETTLGTLRDVDTVADLGAASHLLVEQHER
jgi:rSAM/selenodomain-associated transferase 2/rSAM/selenodomain-associated transferase 1